jgi:uncharacterized protein YkwD
MNRAIPYVLAFASSLLAVKVFAALPSPTTSSTPSQPNQSITIAQSRFDAQLLALTNEQRRRAGLPALRLSSQLGRAAQSHAGDMARNNIFSHTGSNGSSMVDRVKATGYSYSAIGENIAAGDASPEATIRQWMNSPGHRRNILNRNYTEIGFGYVSAPNTQYRHLWVQVFGSPRR